MEEVLFAAPAAPAYDGDSVLGRMEGAARSFTLADGSVYTGDVLNSAFHGEGSVSFPGRGTFTARWEHGVAVDGSYAFADGLKYGEQEWSYAQPPDRRFYAESADGASLEPAGRERLHNGSRAGALPRGCYDLGDGYLNPEPNFEGELLVYAYDGKYLRDLEEGEKDWAMAKCRVGAADGPPPARQDQQAASKIQARYRGRAERREAAAMKAGAVAVQSNFRGWQSRKEAKARSEAAKVQAAAEEEREMNEAAIKMQAIQRGRASRRAHATVNEVDGDGDGVLTADEILDADISDENKESLLVVLGKAEAAGEELTAEAAEAVLAELQTEPAATEPEFDLTDDMVDPAKLIQRRIRERAARKQAIADGASVAPEPAAEQEANVSAPEESTQALETPSEESAAATRIQARRRGAQSRKTQKEAKEQAEMSAAQVKIAAAHRGRKGRREVAELQQAK